MAAGLHWMKVLAASLAVLAAVLAVVSLAGCDEDTAENIMAVKIEGKTFYLELAVNDATRVKGLGDRMHIDPDGGMLFAFPRADKRQFVMRDCAIPIDILFLDANGLVVAQHAMVPEDPRGEEESASDYEQRLQRYSSQFDARYAVELAGGTLEQMNVSEGDRVELDLKKLKAIVR